VPGTVLNIGPHTSKTDLDLILEALIFMLVCMWGAGPWTKRKAVVDYSKYEETE
jgi:hypothetical protein